MLINMVSNSDLLRHLAISHGNKGFKDQAILNSFVFFYVFGSVYMDEDSGEE